MTAATETGKMKAMRMQPQLLHGKSTVQFGYWGPESSGSSRAVEFSGNCYR